MSAESVVLEGRRFAESRMSSTCTITGPAAVPSDENWNEATGQHDLTPTTVYAGPCRIRFGSAIRREGEAVGQFLTEQEPTLFLPIVGSEQVTTDHVVTITANPLDEALVGTRFRIAGVHFQTYATARRFPVEVVS